MRKGMPYEIQLTQWLAARRNTFFSYGQQKSDSVNTKRKVNLRVEGDGAKNPIPATPTKKGVAP